MRGASANVRVDARPAAERALCTSGARPARTGPATAPCPASRSSSVPRLGPLYGCRVQSEITCRTSLETKVYFHHPRYQRHTAMGLSKGTLGLKFMNRQAPAQPPSASAAASTAAGASPASSTAASKSTPAPAQPASARKASTQAKNESKATSTGKREAGKEAAGQSSRPVAAPIAEWNKPSKSTAG